MNCTVPECFMAAFAAGLLFSVVYEVLRIIRVIFPFRWLTFICDILFFLLAAQVVTKLSLSLGDHIRWATVFGFGAGVFAYINTIGRLLNILENAVANAVRTALGAFFRKIGHAASVLFGVIAHTVSRIFGKITKIYSDHVKKRHRHLKKQHGIVYNKECHKDNNGGSENGHVIKAEVRRSVNA